jgi:hypothetical protein
LEVSGAVVVAELVEEEDGACVVVLESFVEVLEPFEEVLDSDSAD